MTDQMQHRAWVRLTFPVYITSANSNQKQNWIKKASLHSVKLLIYNSLNIYSSSVCMFNWTHSIPFVADVLGAEVGVGVDSRQLDAIGLGNLQDLVVDAHGGHALFVSLGQGGLELVVSCDQTLRR